MNICTTISMTDAIGDQVTTDDGRTGTIITAPVIGRTGAVCAGVRFTDGAAKIVKSFSGAEQTEAT